MIDREYLESAKQDPEVQSFIRQTLRPKVRFNSRRETGNIFWILGTVRNILQSGGCIIEYNDMWEQVQNSGSYEEALNIIGKHVILIDEATGQTYS